MNCLTRYEINVGKLHIYNNKKIIFTSKLESKPLNILLNCSVGHGKMSIPHHSIGEQR